MSSCTPTPATAKTPAKSVKRRRAGDDVDGSDDEMAVDSTVETIVRQDLKEAFDVDETWHGADFLAAVKSTKGRKLLHDYVHLWLLFAASYEQGLQFGPQNVYNPRVAQSVGDFIVAEFGLRPKQLQKKPSAGRSLRYLVTFDEGK